MGKEAAVKNSISTQLKIKVVIKPKTYVFDCPGMTFKLTPLVASVRVELWTSRSATKTNIGRLAKFGMVATKGRSQKSGTRSKSSTGKTMVKMVMERSGNENEACEAPNARTGTEKRDIQITEKGKEELSMYCPGKTLKLIPLTLSVSVGSVGPDSITRKDGDKNFKSSTYLKRRSKGGISMTRNKLDTTTNSMYEN